MATASVDTSLTAQQSENGGSSNVEDRDTALGATLEDFVTRHMQGMLSPSYDSNPADSEVEWQGWQHNDYLMSQNESDEATANVLRDLAASLDEPHHPLADDHVPQNNNITCPQKRQREEDDEDYQKVPRNPSVTIVEARRMMNEVLSKRTSARNTFEMAQRQLQACQQHCNVAQREMEHVEYAASQVSQQLCDELLQEDTSWNATYKLLLQFREKHGHTNVPRNPTKAQKEADPDLSKLAGWVGRQRTNYRRPLEDNRRPEDYQIAALERVGFDFDPHRTSWMKRYGELKEFKATHGHFD